MHSIKHPSSSTSPISLTAAIEKGSHEEHLGYSLVVDVVNKYYRVTMSGNIVEFCWVPGHVIIKGYEAADEASKAVLINAVSKCKAQFTDAKQYIDAYNILYVCISSVETKVE